MITQDQAREIMLLTSNYANYEAAAENAYCKERQGSVKMYSDKSNEIYLKLKTLVESLTESK